MSKFQEAVLHGFMIFALATAVAQIQNVATPLIKPMLNAGSSYALHEQEQTLSPHLNVAQIDACVAPAHQKDERDRDH